MKNTACSGNGYKTAQKTERSLFTRMCIGEAIIELMQDKDERCKCFCNCEKIRSVPHDIFIITTILFRKRLLII